MENVVVGTRKFVLHQVYVGMRIVVAGLIVRDRNIEYLEDIHTDERNAKNSRDSLVQVLADAGIP